MNGSQRYGIALLVMITACGERQAGAPMAGMTAEEHARMQAGSNGATDTTGAALRQAVHLTPAQERALGVTYTMVLDTTLRRTVRTVGQILAAEPRLVDVTPKIEGFVERLLVDATGTEVRRGQALLEIYSPRLVAAQEEVLTARRLAEAVGDSGEPGRQARATLEAARRRLGFWDITPEQIERLETTREIRKTMTLVAPANGVVLEKMVFEGQQVGPGMRLYRIADLSEVWVEGEVFEQDIKFLGEGLQAHIEVTAYPGEHLMGRVSFIHPTVTPESRTVRVRLTVPNPGGRLKPGMFTTLYFDADVGGRVVAVPMDAVVVTGERNLVFVRDSSGTLVPRQVALGARAGDLVQVLAGLQSGEIIVASANFLVDAESRLGTTGGTMPGMQHGAVEPESPEPPPDHRHD